MNSPEIEYTRDKIGFDEISSFLKQSDNDFTPPLHTILDLETYATKISTYAKTTEAWANGKLAGFIAAYYNDETKESFVTIIIVLPEYRPYGIFEKLRKDLIVRSKERGYSRILCEVYKENRLNIKLYQRIGYEIIRDKDDLWAVMELKLK